MMNLRFGTRDLLWAMIVTGLVLVFLLHRTQAGLMRQEIHRQQREIDYLTEQLNVLGYEAEFDQLGRPRYFGPERGASKR